MGSIALEKVANIGAYPFHHQSQMDEFLKLAVASLGKTGSEPILAMMIHLKRVKL